MASDLGHEAPGAGSRQQASGWGALQGIRQSAALLARDQGTFIGQLHYDVTSLIPESAVPPGFDMWGFCDRMAQALLWVAATDQPPRVVINSLRQLGGQNWYEGFPDSQYASVAHALIQTVHYLSANIWSTSTGSAWISFFMWVQPHLVAGARDTAARESAAREAAAREAAAQRAAAEREAARVAALSRGHTQIVNNVNIERVASILDDDDEDDVGLGQIMLGMTRNPLRDQSRNQDLPGAVTRHRSPLWLPGKDSNLRKVDQNHLSCH